MMTWWGLALVISFGTCVFFNLNKTFQLDGLRARGWSTGCAALILTPCLFVFDWPDSPVFYVCAFAAALLMSYAGEITFNLSAKYGGPLVSLSKPLAILCAFFIWAAIEFSETIVMLSDPLRVLGISLAFVLAFWSQLRLIKDNVNIKQAMKYLIVAALISGMVSPIVKYGMSYTVEVQQVLIWIFFFHGLGSILCFTRHALKRNNEPVYSKGFVKFGLTLGPFHVVIGAMFAWAVHLSPNPAFVSLITLLSTVWLMLYYALRGQEAHVKPKSVAMLLTAAVVLVLSTKGI